MLINENTRTGDTDYHFREYPVYLPSLQRIAVRLAISRFTAVHLDLYDPDGCIRMQCMRYSEGAGAWCILAEDVCQSSVNSLAGALNAGVWRVCLQVRCAIPDCKSQYSVEILENPDLPPEACLSFCEYRFPADNTAARERGWLRGELHSHTSMSDGSPEPAERMRGFGERGGDFCAVTDHNVLPMGWVYPAVVALRGMELTLPNGHFNLIGLKEAVPFEHVNECPPMVSTIRRLKKQGVFCVLNHPCFSPWHLRWNDFDFTCLDALEVICDPTHARSCQATRQAISLWDKLLNDGLHIWGTGGSDCHFCEQKNEKYDNSPFRGVTGDPSVYVYAQREAASIVQALKKGRFSVSRAGRLSNVCRNGMLRTTLHKDFDPVTSCLGDTFELRLVADGKTVDSAPLTRGVPCVLPDIPSAQWARVELWHQDHGLVAFSNPSFNEHKERTS